MNMKKYQITIIIAFTMISWGDFCLFQTGLFSDCVIKMDVNALIRL